MTAHIELGVNVTSLVCGDPLPGESALDLMLAPAIAPAQDLAHSTMKSARILSPRERRRMQAMTPLKSPVSQP